MTNPYKPKDTFRHDLLGINIVVGRDVEDSDAKTVIDKLLGIKRLFEEKRIDLDLSNLFTTLVIVSSDEDRKQVSNKKTWGGMYFRRSDKIAIDVTKCKNISYSKTGNYDYIDFVLVHEIGHAIHLKYIDRDTQTSYNDIGRFFLDHIAALRLIIKKVNKAKEEDENKLTNADIDRIIGSEVKKEKSYNNKFTLKIENLLPKGLKNIYKQRYDKYKQENSLEDSNYNNIKSSIYALESIMPSDRGLDNIQEDFAENFALFILNPEELIRRSGYFNINRLIRLLTMSRAQGKTIMNAHKNILLVKNYVKILIENMIK
tara:strand:- start:1161 stop:2108 length:948 start_codon:yes stop_codon:yes gene_type:complete